MMLQLITDRIEQDVLSRNEKGSYRWTDLNRVTEAMEYLDYELRKAGYESGYKPVKINRSSVSRLPDGYTELTYIESTGTQYINTGFIPNTNSKLYADAEIVALSANSFMFGSRYGSGNAAFDILAITNGQYRFDFGSATSTVPGSLVGKKSTKFTNTSSYVGEAKATLSSPSLTSSYPIYIFGCNDRGNMNSPIKMRLFNLQLYNGSNLAMDFIPCINISGAVGLYDLVGKKFYGNNGSGEFVAGAPVQTPDDDYVELPGGYTQLEYIESTGTQYINTNTTIDGNTSVNLDVTITDVSGFPTLYGQKPNSSNWNNALAIIMQAENSYRCSYFSSSQILTTLNVLNKRRLIGNNKNVFFVDDNTVSLTYSSGSSTLPLFIFADNVNGVPTQYTKAKLFSCTISNDSGVVKKFIPCKTLTGEIGLYELVNGEFYANAGTGDFIPGNAILNSGVWYENEKPRITELNQYLENVRRIKEALTLLESSPQVPSTPRFLSYGGANDIEQVLLDVERMLENIQSSVNLGWTLGIADVGLYGGV